MNASAPFFPVEAVDTGSGLSRSASSGIQVRDEVAIHCLQGILANPEFTKKGHSATGGPRRAAEMAYEFTDALIEASQPKP
jgi:hypothetical protein